MQMHASRPHDDYSRLASRHFGIFRRYVINTRLRSFYRTVIHMNNILTQNDIRKVDYKDVDLLKQFINPHGRIMGHNRTGSTSKQQRTIDEAIKRARFMGLLPYIQK